MFGFTLYVTGGVVGGLVSGLFGMGGGLAVVPVLVIALGLSGISQVHVMHLAVGTSLAVMVLTSAYTTLLRRRKGDMDRQLLRTFLLPVVLGGIAGSAAGGLLPGWFLRALFVFFVLYMICRMLERRVKLIERKAATPPSPEPLTASSGWGYGVVAGGFGALLGIGVAAVLTPLLIKRSYTMQAASSLAATMAFVIGLAAGSGYVVGGLSQHDLPPLSLGYIYVPAFVGLLLGASGGSPLGVYLSHRLPQQLQVDLFVTYLAIVLIVMVLG